MCIQGFVLVSLSPRFGALFADRVVGSKIESELAYFWPDPPSNFFHRHCLTSCLIIILELYSKRRLHFFSIFFRRSITANAIYHMLGIFEGLIYFLYVCYWLRNQLS
jgi:hypothetical protein